MESDQREINTPSITKFNKYFLTYKKNQEHILTSMYSV